jgi:hypothetical protein
MMKQLKRSFMMLIFLLIGVLMFGQGSTTSSMSGKIVDKDGKSLPGATIIAVHVPSGTQYGALANNDGLFIIQGMRPGGPYTVEISFVGYSKKTLTDITLNLGEKFTLNTSLDESAAALAEVVVVGAKTPQFNSEKNGTSININNRQLTLMPTVSRSINDITRLTPQANGNQIGGGNYRQNFITVDGAQFNNAFGIGTNLPGNGTPISLDAIDQISVNITPYDVRQSGFIGASVNAVTRSGNNEFSGSVYTYMNNQNYKGNKVGDATFIRNQASYSMQGFRLGGPIIKNKLFFFLNAETEKNTVPGPQRVASTPDAPADYANNIARPTVADMDMMSAYLKDNYGYITGPYQGYSQKSPGTKFLARVDWNINNNNKFNVRYSYQASKSPSYPSTSTSPFSGIYTNNRQAMDAMWYQNSGYYQQNNFSSWSGELNSTLFGGKVLNTLRGTYSYQNEPRSTEGKLFPFVDILQAGIPYVSFGTELFSYGNLRQVATTTFNDDVTWSWGKNNMTAGINYEHDNTKNGFMRFGSSFYVFKDWNTFVSGGLPNNYGITFSNTPGYAQAFPSFQFNQIAGYIQDELNVNSRLKVVGGIRLDQPSYPSPGADHPIIATLDFGGNTYHTSTLPKSKIMASPRIGFNFDLKEDRSLVLRGGTGIFTGRVPFVWIVGQVGDAGMVQTTQALSGANVPGPFNPAVNAYYPETQPAAGTIVPGSFTVISPNFKMPQTWKSSLALDARLPWGLKGTLEGVYNKDINTAFFVNEGLQGAGNMNITGYPDNRIIYPTTNPAKYYQLINAGGIVTTTAGTGNGVSPIVLENRKGGYYYSLTAKLEKSFTNGFSGMIAYTHSVAKNLVDGAGDQAASAWNGNANVNGANSAELSYTNYVMPDHLIASASYRIEYLKFFGTSVSLFYDGESAGRFSYVYSSNIVRDGAGSNNLIYVPKDPSEITFVPYTFTPAGATTPTTWSAQEQSDAFFAYVAQDKYLKTRMGKYAERNGAIYPWVNRFDVQFKQDFFINVAGKRNTLQLSLDILNFGNLINSGWGVVPFYNQNNILVMTNNAAVVSGGAVKPTFRLNPYNNEMLNKTFSNTVGYASTYSMQFGIRYIFN